MIMMMGKALISNYTPGFKSSDEDCDENDDESEYKCQIFPNAMLM